MHMTRSSIIYINQQQNSTITEHFRARRRQLKSDELYVSLRQTFNDTSLAVQLVPVFQLVFPREGRVYKKFHLRFSTQTVTSVQSHHHFSRQNDEEDVIVVRCM
jgi:hypothetical protein